MVTDFIHFSFVIVEKFKATSLVFFFLGGGRYWYRDSLTL